MACVLVDQDQHLVCCYDNNLHGNINVGHGVTANRTLEVLEVRFINLLVATLHLGCLWEWSWSKIAAHSWNSCIYCMQLVRSMECADQSAC